MTMTDEKIGRQLQVVRDLIDAVDYRLLHLLLERRKLSVDAGRIKRHAGLPRTDKEREQDQLKAFVDELALLGVEGELAAAAARVWTAALEFSKFGSDT